MILRLVSYKLSFFGKSLYTNCVFPNTNGTNWNEKGGNYALRHVRMSAGDRIRQTERQLEALELLELKLFDTLCRSDIAVKNNGQLWPTGDRASQKACFPPFSFRFVPDCNKWGGAHKWAKGIANRWKNEGDNNIDGPHNAFSFLFFKLARTRVDRWYLCAKRERERLFL